MFKSSWSSSISKDPSTTAKRMADAAASSSQITAPMHYTVQSDRSLQYLKNSKLTYCCCWLEVWVARLACRSAQMTPQGQFISGCWHWEITLIPPFPLLNEYLVLYLYYNAVVVEPKNWSKFRDRGLLEGLLIRRNSRSHLTRYIHIAWRRILLLLPTYHLTPI